MKHKLYFMIAPLRSRFPLQHEDLVTKRSRWGFRAKSRIGSFRLSLSSVCRHCLPLPRWNTSTYVRVDIRHRIGKTISRISSGWKFYIYFPLRKIFTSPGSFYHASRSPCRSSSEEGRLKCCPPCGVFSWRRSSHLSLSLGPSETSSLHDTCPDTLYLFRLGKDSGICDGIRCHILYLYPCSSLYFVV